MTSGFNWAKALEITLFVVIGVALIWTIIVPIVCFQYVNDLIKEDV